MKHLSAYIEDERNKRTSKSQRLLIEILNKEEGEEIVDLQWSHDCVKKTTIFQFHSKVSLDVQCLPRHYVIDGMAMNLEELLQRLASWYLDLEEEL